MEAVERRRHGIGDWLLAGEAWLLLGAMRALLQVVPFKRGMAMLGMGAIRPTAIPPAGGDAPASQRAVERADRVRRGIEAAARRTPWDSKCLAQSLAGAAMLRWWGGRVEVYFGVRPASADGTRPMTAHSWLVSAGRMVTGEAGHDDYAVVAVYLPLRDIS